MTRSRADDGCKRSDAPRCAAHKARRREHRPHNHTAGRLDARRRLVRGAPGLRAAWNWSLDMNFLMVIAAAGAWIIGEREEAAATLILFAIADRVPQYDQWDRALSSRQFAMASFGSQSAVS